jgi:hypothetical protein
MPPSASGMSLLRSISSSSATWLSRPRDPRLCGPTSRSGCYCRSRVRLVSLVCATVAGVYDEQASRPPSPASQRLARSFVDLIGLSTCAPPETEKRDSDPSLDPSSRDEISTAPVAYDRRGGPSFGSCECSHLTGAAMWGCGFCDLRSNKFGEVAHRIGRRYVSPLRLRPG